MPIPPNQLSLQRFFEVAEHGSYKRAVAHTGIGQPTYSHHINLLEGQLGVALIHRGNTALSRRGPVPLTAPGKKLFEFIAPYFRDLPSVAAAIAEKSAHKQ